jgi:hypothetical protein
MQASHELKSKYAQFLLDFTSDVLEKLHSLLMWRRPQTTMTFLIVCCCALFFASIMSTQNYFMCICEFNLIKKNIYF